MASGDFWDRVTLGRRRRARAMRRRLRELDHPDAPPSLPQRRSANRPRSSGLLGKLAATLAFLGLVAVGLGVFATTQLGIPLSQLVGEAQRLADAPDVRRGGGTYAFLQTQPGSDDPVTYNPCEPLRVVLNPDGAPDGGNELVEEALDQVSEESGLVLQLVGETDERPTRERPITDPARYGGGTVPALIAWSTPEETPALGGDVAGLGGSVARTNELTGRSTYLTGSVTLDAPALATAMSHPGGAERVRAIILHEVGHLVGLAHVDDRRELMHAENSGRVEFGPGDLEGLALLGSGPCRN